MDNKRKNTFDNNIYNKKARFIVNYNDNKIMQLENEIINLKFEINNLKLKLNNIMSSNKKNDLNNLWYIS